MNSICPGWVLTHLVEQQVSAISREKDVSMEKAKSELLSEKTPSNEFTTPEQIGDTVVYLCSQAADNMTASTITLDGGWVAR